MRSLFFAALRQVVLIAYCMLLVMCVMEVKEIWRKGHDNPMVYSEEAENDSDREREHRANIDEMHLPLVQYVIGCIGAWIMSDLGCQWQSREMVDFSTYMVVIVIMSLIAFVCYTTERRATKARLAMFAKEKVRPDPEKQKRRKKGVTTIARPPFSSRSMLYTVVIVSLSTIGTIMGHPIKAMLWCIVILMIVETVYLLRKQYRGEVPPNPDSKELLSVEVKGKARGIVKGVTTRAKRMRARYEIWSSRRDPERKWMYRVVRRIRGY